jgi:hypothetical protein
MLPDLDDLRRGLESVSIRGRMAFAVDSVQAWVDQDGFDGPALRSLLELMVEFCSSADLGDWDRKCIEAAASSMIREETGSPSLVEAVDAAIEDVGRGDLFGGVIGVSLTTLNGALRVARLAAAAGVSLPSLGSYAFSSFDEVHGWGLEIHRVSPEHWQHLASA